jgi:hypothetical protein
VRAPAAMVIALSGTQVSRQRGRQCDMDNAVLAIALHSTKIPNAAEGGSRPPSPATDVVP